ncbi:MAG TPA: GNAT family N-acetyltransferase, partial [Pyrinomonadaceae bacterium]|nr:GNAT family N-acetyltransferase [Pyrinomonadaceae bacterium]
MLEFFQAESTAQINEARKLFLEYSDGLGLNLCFQNFEKELAELPGAYAQPDGRLFLAMHENGIAGCVCLRKIGERTCEMKRLYVRPEFRGKGVGRALAEKIIEEARSLDYERMRLDT